MKAIAYLKRGVRRLSAPVRPLPGLLCIGAMRSGTTSLHRALARHPEVGMPTRKEVQFFDINYHKGTNWYRAFFPIGRRVGVDISPTYMANPETAYRAMDVVPDARVVALLRDPVVRAWSLFRLRQKWGDEKRTFGEAMEAELVRGTEPVVYTTHKDIPYLSSGLYAAQIRPWLEVFGPDRFLILDSDELFTDPSRHMTRIQELMGVSVVDLAYPHINAAPDHPTPQAIDQIKGYFDESDAELRRLTGRSFSWM